MQIICRSLMNNKKYVIVFNKAHFGAYVNKIKKKHQDSALKFVEIIRNGDFSFNDFVQTTHFPYELTPKSDFSMLLYLYFQVSVIFLRLEIVILYTICKRYATY